MSRWRAVLNHFNVDVEDDIINRAFPREWVREWCEGVRDRGVSLWCEGGLTV